MSTGKLIAVFGSTGNQGGSVVRALANSGLFNIRAITRNSNSDKAKQLKANFKNVSVVEANLDNPATLDAALKDCYGVFLVTDFASHFEKKEVQQGKNTIDSAIRNGVKQLVFSGLEDVKSVIDKPCYHFDFKAEIENYGLSFSDKIDFTSVRLSFYFENFSSICMNKIGHNQYILNPPMENVPMYGNSVDDIGDIVLKVFQNSGEFKSKILGIASEFLTIAQYADIMSKHLGPKKFFDGKITAEQYSKFQFPGVEDIIPMFEFYRTGKMERDIELSKRLSKNLLGFEDWVVKNKDRLLKEIN